MVLVCPLSSVPPRQVAILSLLEVRNPILGRLGRLPLERDPYSLGLGRRHKHNVSSSRPLLFDVRIRDVLVRRDHHPNPRIGTFHLQGVDGKIPG